LLSVAWSVSNTRAEIFLHLVERTQCAGIRLNQPLLKGPRSPAIAPLPVAPSLAAARPPLKSKLVTRVTPKASKKEIAAATKRWFGFLQTLVEIVEEAEGKTIRREQDVKPQASAGEHL
jgi:hypothetical protein